jgi:hypothetical protein
LVKSGATDSQIKELLMSWRKSDETVLMSLTGNFDLNEISILTDKMRIPGGDDLKRATKEKIKMKTIYSLRFFLSLLVVGCNTEPTLQKLLCGKYGK